jgi:hypothetical protein
VPLSAVTAPGSSARRGAGESRAADERAMGEAARASAVNQRMLADKLGELAALFAGAGELLDAPLVCVRICRSAQQGFRADIAAGPVRIVFTNATG